MRTSASFVGLTLLVGAGACGLDAIGGAGADAPGVTPSADGSAEDGAATASEEPEEEAPPPLAEGEVVIENDAGATADVGAPYDAGALPTDPGPPLAYVVSGRFWAFNPVTRQWGGGIQLPAGSCPGLEELALDAFGRLFAVGKSGNNLYRVTTSPLSCVKIGAGGSGYPRSLAFAPRGTMNAYDEELVGYRDNGDYVRVDRTTGTLVVVTAGAFAGRSVGDVVNIGPKGYVVARGTGCTGDCLWEVSLATGAPTTATPIGTIPTTRQVTALAHWAGKLYSFGYPDEIRAFLPTNPAGASAVGGPPGYSGVGYLGAATRTIAPTM